MFDLPDHLSSLNALEPLPTQSPMDPSVEAAVWDFLNTDALFSNFGVAPSAVHDKAIPPVKEDKAAPADLKSFIEQFASEPTNQYNLPMSFEDVNAIAGPSTASTPAGVNTSDILSSGTNGEDRVSGAKRLKKMGAAAAEIEEDKRRRNTEASARFRLKKKERESALEIRAKELEAQVQQLTAEKTSLENENRLLKSIVLSGNVKPQDQLDLQYLKRKREDGA